jgi:hypothetical protein
LPIVSGLQAVEGTSLYDLTVVYIADICGQELAVPFVYRSLCFANTDRLQKAVLAFERVKEAAGLDVGTLVHRLSIQDSVNLALPASMDALFSLLIFANRLKDVRLPNSAYSGILRCMVHNCADQLCYLDLSPTAVMAGGLACISRLSHLEKLVIHSAQVDPPEHGWTLKRLRDLVWRMLAPSFLAKCRFPGLKDAEIFLAPLDDIAIGHLRVFLTVHPGIRVLRVQYADPALAERISSVMSCEHLWALGSVPPAASMVFLPPPVRTLTIPSRVSGAPPWVMLDALLSAELGSGLEEIRVQGDADGSFLWTGGPRSAQHAQFIGHLLGYAPRLRARGIRLVDDCGECPYLSVT